jgi:uncharacterized protein YndB with AHSA1/START domain
MLVRTTTLVRRPPEAVWPLLCDSRITSTPRCPVFRLGAPTPVECRLPAGPGEVGASRQCVSDQGVVHQRITEWSPPARLAFRMERTDLPFGSCVSALSDTFELTPAAGGRATRLTRTTRVEVRGRLRWARALAVGIGLKAVHRFVFRDWRR